MLIPLVIAAVATLGAVAYKKSKSVDLPEDISSEESPALSLVTSYDKGLSHDEATAMQYALTHEKDGLKLREFGQVMLPDFPVASAALLAKSGGIIYHGSPIAHITQNVRVGATGKVAVHGESKFGDIWDDAGDIASSAVEVVTHPGDDVSGAINIITHPGDDIKAFGKASVDILHTVPGMDWAGDRLKDFSNTGFGEWALRIMATYGYYAFAPYLGAQLASVAFALPGVAKGDSFTQSWMKETTDRAIKTFQIISGQKIPDVGDAGSEQLNKFLSNNDAFKKFSADMTKQIASASQSLGSKVGSGLGDLMTNVVPGAIAKKLGKTYGIPPDFAKMAADAGGIQQVNAATAYDLIAGTNYQGTIHWDAWTGVDVLAHIKAAKESTVQSLRKDIGTPAGKAKDALMKEYRAKRPTVIKYYLNLARQS